MFRVTGVSYISHRLRAARDDARQKGQPAPRPVPPASPNSRRKRARARAYSDRDPKAVDGLAKSIGRPPDRLAGPDRPLCPTPSRSAAGGVPINARLTIWGVRRLGSNNFKGLSPTEFSAHRHDRVNLADRNRCRDHRHDDRFVGGLRDSGSDYGRFHSAAGLAKGTGFVELRSRPEP